MAYWLVKSEPNIYSIADLERDGSSLWEGVRNYQARNYLQQMQVGELLLFYHSNTEPIGVAGLCSVKSLAEPDPTQFDKKSDYFDPKATQAAARWYCPRIEFVARFEDVLTLAQLRGQPELLKMVLLQRGSRLSVQPVTLEEFRCVQGLAKVALPKQATSTRARAARG